MEEIVNAYLDAKDYWQINPDEIGTIITGGKADFGKSLYYYIIEGQLDSLTI